MSNAGTRPLVKFVAESLGHSRRRRARARVHRIGVRVEHVQPSDPGALSRRAVVVQPALHHVHHRAGAARAERGVRWTVGRAARTARGGHRRGPLLRHGAADRRALDSLLRQTVLVFLGMGVIGGIGCGLGYISPVSTLVKWFPDRRGMATGMAIMGFGGGAFIAGYLNVALMDRLGVATHGHGARRDLPRRSCWPGPG